MVGRWKICGGKCGGKMVVEGCKGGEKAVRQRRDSAGVVEVLVECWWKKKLVVKMVVKGGGSCGGSEAGIDDLVS